MEKNNQLLGDQTRTSNNSTCVPLGSFPRDEHPVAAIASTEKYTTKKGKEA